MRHVAKVAVTVMLTVLALFATMIPANAAPLHPFRTSGQAGVAAAGKYARAVVAGQRGVAVRARVYDGLRDGRYAGIVVHFKSGRGATSVGKIWTTGGVGSLGTGRVASTFYAHLYIKECVGVNASNWRPTSCGPFKKMF